MSNGISTGRPPVIIDVAGLRVASTIRQDIWDKAWLASFFAGAGRID